MPKTIVTFREKPIVAHLIDSLKKAGVSGIYLITRAWGKKNATLEELTVRKLLSSHFIFKGNDFFKTKYLQPG